MTKKRISDLRTDQVVAAYWDVHSFVETAEDTMEATIRFVKKPNPTMKRKSVRSTRAHEYYR